MSGIAIYVEGGGDSRDTKSALREGMGNFLREIRDLAQGKRWRWKVVACGGRRAACVAFENARNIHPETFNVLLVDAEGPVSADPVRHLNDRDGWSLDAGADRVHLMVQTMEAWIVADADALERFYGQGLAERPSCNQRS